MTGFIIIVLIPTLDNTIDGSIGFGKEEILSTFVLQGGHSKINLLEWYTTENVS